jgi:spermidine synthase
MPDKFPSSAKSIFNTQDEWGRIEIIETPEKRSLYFENRALQSSMSLKDPYALVLQNFQYLLLTLLFNPDPKSVLILGLGGGSMAKFLWKYFPHCQIDAVENRQKVVDVCYDYFELPRSERLHVHVEDAFEFIQRSPPSHYDIIFVNLFSNEGMPKEVGPKLFFNNCRKSLNSSGILGWNTWYATPDELLVQSVKSLCQIFGKDILMLPAIMSGNNVFIVFPADFPQISEQEFNNQALNLKKQTHLDFPTIVENLNYFKKYWYPC